MNKADNVIGFARARAARAPEEGLRPGQPRDGAAAQRDDDDGGPQDEMSSRLLEVAERGDRDAFAALFRHFGPRVRAYLLRAGGDTGKVDDVLQDTFAAVWQKAHLFDGRRATAAAWIFAIARNRRIDAYRRTRRPEFDPEDPAFIPDPLPDGEQSVAARQRAEAVRSALSALSDEQREVLHLSFYEGETYASIAVRLGLPLGTVKSRARLGFGHLRTALLARREDLR